MSTSCSRTFNRWILMRRNLGGRTFYLEEDVGPRWRLEEDHQVLPRNFQWSWLAFNCYTDLRSNRGSKITLNILDSWVSQGCRGETIDWLGECRGEEVPEGLPEFSKSFGSRPRIWYVCTKRAGSHPSLSCCPNWQPLKIWWWYSSEDSHRKWNNLDFIQTNCSNWKAPDLPLNTLVGDGGDGG